MLKTTALSIQYPVAAPKSSNLFCHGNKYSVAISWGYGIPMKTNNPVRIARSKTQLFIKTYFMKTSLVVYIISTPFKCIPYYSSLLQYIIEILNNNKELHNRSSLIFIVYYSSLYFLVDHLRNLMNIFQDYYESLYQIRYYRYSIIYLYLEQFLYQGHLLHRWWH